MGSTIMTTTRMTARKTRRSLYSPILKIAPCAEPFTAIFRYPRFSRAGPALTSL